MFETKYSKVLTVLLVIIIVAIIGLGGYLGYNYYKNYTIGNDADKYVSTFVEEVADNTTNTTNTEVSQGSISENIAASETSSSTSNKTQTYKGFNVLGTIEIPKTSVKYPILEPPSGAGNKLEVAVAVDYPYSNPVLNTVGNITISGHNYRNGTFFSDNNKLTNGDKIYITDLTGTKVEYVVYNKFIADFNDRSYDNRDTDGKREITLYSCTDDLSGRLIVEARAD